MNDEQTTKQFDARECLQDKLNDDYKNIDVDSAYDEMLDEMYSFEKVGGPFVWMYPSRVLHEVDPTAYRCGKVDWLDGENYVEIGDYYYTLDDIESARDELVEERNSEIEDLQEEISILINELEPERDNEEINSNTLKIKQLEEEIKELKKLSW